MTTDQASDFMPEEDYEEEMEEEDDSQDYDAPIRDMSGVFEKVMSPRHHDKEVSRDLKLTKTSYADREYLMKLKMFIQRCEQAGLKKAVEFYRGLNTEYINALASDNGFTAKNLITTRNFQRKEIDAKKKKRGFFGR